MITPAYSPTATERVLPRMALDFTTASLDPRVTVTRALNTATIINSSGLVEGVNANLPRFDYDPSTLACKGLLIEETRSNLFVESSNFSTLWVTDVGACTVTSDDAISPDGTQNADKLAFVGTNANRYQTVVGLTIGASYTMTVWLRVASGTASVSIGNINAGVNVAQTVTTTWQRFTVTQTASAAIRYPQITATNVDVFAWGAQLEAGAFATSYIPTVATSLTRNADAVAMTGTNFSDWYNASQGTLSVVADSGNVPNSDGIVRMAAAITSNVSYTNAVRLERVSGQYRAVTTVAGSAALVVGTWGVNTVGTLVSAYGANAVAAFNGAAAQPFAQTAPVSPLLLGIGSNGSNANFFCGHIKSIRYFPQRLLNAETQAFSK
jgi:hypothetical protein